jgi:NADPH:quinone reductase-like Zn-dependent oxidoreductase
MKAIVCEKFGPPEVLELKDVEKPTPKDKEVLIKTYASSINALDITFRNGAKQVFGLVRVMMSGIRKPRKKITGLDLSGEVVAIGKKVTRFNIGDQIFGFSINAGACAEYTCVSEATIARKPTITTYEEVGAVCCAGMPALAGLRKLGEIQRGQSVLIYGASGGIGTFAVQLAKIFETEVTAVCSESNFELVQSLGADAVIDYTKEDFTQNNQKYDLIFDAVGKTSFSHSKGSLKQKGIYVTVDFMRPKKHLLQMVWTKFRSKKCRGGMLGGSTADLEYLGELIEQGKMKVVIDRRYPLEQIVDAHKYYEKGHSRGKVAIAVREQTNSLVP